MRIETPSAGGPSQQAEAAGCGGFRLAFGEAVALGACEVRLLPGSRRLSDGVIAAVVRGLSEAPALLREALRLSPRRRPFDRVEAALQKGGAVQGEAMPLGAGVIRLQLGEDAPAEDAARIARHEALHLYLAAGLQGGDRWSDPELAFSDWIVRGIEGGLDAALPRFRAPLPGVLSPLPKKRVEVVRQLANVSAAPGAARRYFGDKLADELARLEGGEAALVEQKQLWLVEAALGTHYIEAAGLLRIDEADALRPVLLDDWLFDYERYRRGVANAPSGVGHVWRISEPDWSSDPLVRLSVAAQALQCDDHAHFDGESFRASPEPVVWKNGGRVRLPLVVAAGRARPSPLHGFRAVLREPGTPECNAALALVEDAAAGEARHFEARALWPRVLARLLASDLPRAAECEPPPAPLVQIIGDSVSYTEWSAAAAVLCKLFPEIAAWVPRVAEPQHAPALAEAPRSASSIVLVHAGPLSAAALLSARQLAARLPVRAALFRDGLGRGDAFEELPDLPAPLDPRYREEIWTAGSRLPAHAAALVTAADEATKRGQLTAPLAHLLSVMAVGVLECHY